MDKDELKQKPQLRNSFKAGLLGILKISFSEAEMKIEAKMNKKLIFVFFGTLIGFIIALSVGLAIGFSELAFLAIPIVPVLIAPLALLEINEKITMDLNGIVSSGVVWPRPCEISWAELEKIDINGMGIIFKKSNSKGKVLIPFAPEVLYVAAYYNKKNNDDKVQKNK